MKELSLVPRWLKGILAFGAGFLVVWGLFGFPNGGGFAFWESAEPPSKEREHVRSIIEEVITDWAAADGVHGPSVGNWVESPSLAGVIVKERGTPWVASETRCILYPNPHSFWPSLAFALFLSPQRASRSLTACLTVRRLGLE